MIKTTTNEYWYLDAIDGQIKYVGESCCLPCCLDMLDSHYIDYAWVWSHPPFIEDRNGEPGEFYQKVSKKDLFSEN